MIKRVFISYSFLHRNQYIEFHRKLKNFFNSKSIEVYSFVFDFKEKLNDKEIMAAALAEIDSSDILLAEAETMSFGVGLEAGYAKAKGKQVIYLFKENSQKQQTLAGIADHIVQYQTVDDVIKWFESNYFPTS